MTNIRVIPAHHAAAVRREARADFLDRAARFGFTVTPHTATRWWPPPQECPMSATTRLTGVATKRIGQIADTLDGLLDGAPQATLTITAFSTFEIVDVTFSANAALGPGLDDAQRRELADLVGSRLTDVRPATYLNPEHTYGLIGEFNAHTVNVFAHFDALDQHIADQRKLVGA